MSEDFEKQYEKFIVNNVYHLPSLAFDGFIQFKTNYLEVSIPVYQNDQIDYEEQLEEIKNTYSSYSHLNILIKKETKA